MPDTKRPVKDQYPIIEVECQIWQNDHTLELMYPQFNVDDTGEKDSYTGPGAGWTKLGSYVKRTFDYQHPR